MLYILAGHHDNDPGAIGNGFKEADLTKELRQLVTDRVLELSPSTRVYNDNDSDSLNVVIAKITPEITAKDSLIEFHFDSFTNATATGSTAIVSAKAGSKSKQIAAEIVDVVSKVLGVKNRGVKDETQSARGRLAVVNMIGAAVLFEVCFISNPDDVERYQKHKHWVADEIARVLIKYDK